MSSLGPCLLCHLKPAVTEHHITFKSHQGSDEEHNLIPLCDFCHQRVHRNKKVWEYVLQERKEKL